MAKILNKRSLAAVLTSAHISTALALGLAQAASADMLYQPVKLNFSQPRSFDVARGAKEIAIADFNADGVRDLAASGALGISQVRNRNTVPGRLELDATEEVADKNRQSYNLRDINVVDINADHSPDIMGTFDTFRQIGYALYSSKDAESSFYDYGHDLFLSLQPCLAQQGIDSYMTTGDLNLDGVPEIAISTAGPNCDRVYLINNDSNECSGYWCDERARLEIWPNESHTSGAPKYLYDNLGADELRGVAMPDINSDGKLDLAFVSDKQGLGSGGPIVYTLTNRTDTPEQRRQNRDTDRYKFKVGRTTPREEFPAPPGLTKLLASDFNGDGRDDLLALQPQSDAVAAFRNIYGGQIVGEEFALATTFQAGDGPVDLELADINSDGLRDVIVANELRNVSVLINRSTSTSIDFFAPMELVVGGRPSDVAAADLDRDSDLDIVFANGNVGVLENLKYTETDLPPEPPPPPPPPAPGKPTMEVKFKKNGSLQIKISASKDAASLMKTKVKISGRKRRGGKQKKGIAALMAKLTLSLVSASGEGVRSFKHTEPRKGLKRFNLCKPLKLRATVENTDEEETALKASVKAGRQFCKKKRSL